MFDIFLCIFFILAFGCIKPNIIQNGDFEAGDVDPWRCIGCQCSVPDKYLGNTYILIH